MTLLRILGYKCDKCDSWYHIKCINMDQATYENLGSSAEQWFCANCIDQENESSLQEEVNIQNQDIYDGLRDKINAPGIKVAHINVNGLFNKLAEIRLLLQETRFDIFGVSETHLKGDIKDEQITIDGYKLVRKDRKACSTWGGCLIYYKQSLNVIKRDDITLSNNLEQVWIEVTLASQKLLVGSFYRQPTDNNFLDNLQVVLERLWLKRANILIMGDFNADVNFRGKSKAESTLGKRLLQVTKSFNLENVVKEYTRITEATSTIIDLIFTSNISKVKVAGAHNLGISDHHLVYATINLHRQKSKPIIKEVKDYKNMNLEKLRLDLEGAPWHICQLFDNIDDATWAWEYMFKDIMNEHIRTRKAKVCTNGLRWMNANIRKEMNRRYTLLKQAQNQPRNAGAWKQHRKQRNRVTRIIREAEAEYWKDKFENTKSSGDFWNVVREMQGKRKCNIGAIKGENGNIITDAKEKAESFNQFFAKVGENLAAKIQVDLPDNENEYIHHVL